MCGINGILRLNPDLPPIDKTELICSRDYMKLRGPDGYGDWISPSGDVGLGHRRLAIIDLSPAGAQPMSWDNGRYQITFNGEVYNYEEIRNELLAQGVQFHSHCDTEVILALYAREGVAMLKRLRGMFAFALWDEQEKTLFLARDPYGIKPLYYTTEGGYLRFASQVKALEAAGKVSKTVDARGLVGFLLWGSVPEPYTIREAISALPAGHFMLIRHGKAEIPQSYYCFGEFDHVPAQDTKTALEESIQAHLVADVPVAVFLSAGLDSTLIAALASRHTKDRLLTMTLAFDNFVGTPYDEAPLAAQVAKQLGTEHIERHVDRKDFMNLWDDALHAMDQPSIDGFNTFVISQVAHQAGLKVVLSGVGGDELFGGYSSFREVPRWNTWTKRGRAIPMLPSLWSPMIHPLFRHKPKLRELMRYGRGLAGNYYLRRGLFLPDEIPMLMGHASGQVGLSAYNPIQAIQNRLDGNKLYQKNQDAWFAVHIMESEQYLQNQLLRDSDWASMAHSLELRPPLVDAWLREQFARHQFEPARSQNKATLVKQIAPELPEALWNRPKSGFFIPVMDWIGTPDSKQTATQSRNWGRDSRRLAIEVLKAFEIEVQSDL